VQPLTPRASDYVVEHIRSALATDERLSALDVEVRVQANQVSLIGSVQSHERRQAIEAIARSVVPRHDVVNLVEVVDLDGNPVTAPSINAIRVAAVGDVHLGADSEGVLRRHLQSISGDADLLLLAGDLTRHGTEDEARVVAGELRGIEVPVVAVLGNHDYHSDQHERVAKVLEGVGIVVLEKSGCVLDVRGTSVGIAGAKGFGGGFAGACGSEFGEPMMRGFIAHTREAADGLHGILQSLDTDLRIALLHFSPVEDTLRGERLEIYPWLGSYLLAEAIDGAGCDFVFHGHAHSGSETGLTPGGVAVRNVAQPLLGQAYKVYPLEPAAVLADITALGEVAG